ncbi:MAG TPA: phospho-N-acetylmuramoyl-pentapeptide-transferase [Candidatus Rubrimentiphilum sp.]|nr:phospho-N-acetylmuramoyl-pentapeptide-transferase [Candidatus Rubrimentiphilum sp.]
MARRGNESAGWVSAMIHAMTVGDWQSYGIEVAIGFVITAIAGYVLLLILRRLRLRQTVYEDAPKTHLAKSGTPTMGGLAILSPLALVFVNGGGLSQGARALLFLVLACAAVGLIDDYIGVRLGKNRGFRARTKLLLTALIAVMFLRLASDADYHVSMGALLFPPDTLFHAGSFELHASHWLWLILGIIAIAGTIHAVNLTDGLDGLATGSLIPPITVFWVIAIMMNIPSGDSWPGLLPLVIGGLLGFFIYNRFPAKMIMGDTGSLALGALLSGAAVLTGEMLLLVLVGGVFVAEALSVMLQVVYFKLAYGKRIFKMSPLHHHFELSGWPETKVTTRFWLASAICSAVGLAIVR